MKTVGIISSPRKGMNTDTLVTKILEGVSSKGAIVEKIYLNDLKIMPCQACSKFPAPDYCFFKDGMEKVYYALENADALIIGTPAYFGTMSAQLKLMIDRSNCLAEMSKNHNGKLIFKSRLKKKKGIFVWVANMSKDFKCVSQTIKIWSQYFANIDWIDTLIANQSDTGKGAKYRNELLKNAYETGIKLGSLWSDISDQR